MENNQIVLLGAGKTGKYVIDLGKDLYKDVLVFNSQNIFSSKKVSNCSGGICFLTAATLNLYIDEMLSCNFPWVIGTTGFKWSEDLKKRIESKKRIWVYASNFSFGLQIIKQLCQTLNTLPLNELVQSGSLHDIHHKQKVDSPSGTALSIKSWLNLPLEIVSHREGDEVGTHQLVLSMLGETISLEHKALSRTIFAQGALRTLNFVQKNYEKMQYGLLNFDQLGLNMLNGKKD